MSAGAIWIILRNGAMSDGLFYGLGLGFGLGAVGIILACIKDMIIDWWRTS